MDLLSVGIAVAFILREIVLTAGSQICDTHFENISIICDDGYCCDFHEDHYHSCCYYFYALWYFWVGLFVVLALLGCGIYNCWKYKKSPRQPYPSPFSVSMNVGPQEIEKYPIPDDCELPTYAELKAQGMKSQFVEYSKHEGKVNIVVPQSNTPDLFSAAPSTSHQA